MGSVTDSGCRKNLKDITGYLHEDRNAILIISRSFLLRMRSVSDSSCRKNLKDITG
jgi:hypothetical protein